MLKQTLKNFSPTRDWILLEDPRKKETESGIILPEDVQKKYQSNIVKALAVGPDVKQAAKGDDIMVNPVQTGTIVEIERKSYVMIPEHFCMGVFKN